MRTLGMGVEGGVQSDVFVSGGYDHCVKLWDVRLERRLFMSNYEMMK